MSDWYAQNATGRGLDKTAQEGLQAADSLRVQPLRHSRLRVRTLVSLRWAIIGGELLLLFAAWAFELNVPFGWCVALIAAGAWANLLTTIASPGQRVFGDTEGAAQLCLDILQLAGLLFLTGGPANPFILVLMAPVTLAAASLPRWQVALVAALSTGVTIFLTLHSLPLPVAPDQEAVITQPYRVAVAAAILTGTMLIGGYVRQAALESGRMALALDVTQSVLSREQRLSALGALAAAAAHELGTPLATIAVVAKEMAREAATPQAKEDAELLVAQAARCRDILRRLTDAPAAASDEVHERMTLRQLLEDVVEPHSGVKGVRVEAIVTGQPGQTPPTVRRMPEVIHAIASFVENAVDFAASEVLVTARFEADAISVEVRDDGAGFAPEILAKLGEPYVTTRPGAEGSRTGHIGMGLGFFIAKTLLERTGAVVNFQNGRLRGAVVSARWARDRIEAAPE